MTPREAQAHPLDHGAILELLEAISAVRTADELVAAIDRDTGGRS